MATSLRKVWVGAHGTRKDVRLTEDLQMNGAYGETTTSHEKQQEYADDREVDHEEEEDVDVDVDEREDDQPAEEDRDEAADVDEEEAMDMADEVAEDHAHEADNENENENEDDDDTEPAGYDNNDEAEDSSDDDVVDETVQHDMEKLQGTFPSFRNQFRLIKRIGEGTFSTVYKAEDLQYERYDNSWDWDQETNKWTPPPPTRGKRTSSRNGHHSQTQQQQQQQQQQQHREPHKDRQAAPPPHTRRAKFVALKKIYVTSSPLRIFNELELLHDLRSSPAVCPLITAFRSSDQVVAVLPYFRHQDFRDYYRRMTVPDMAIYLRSLFSALAAVHRARILHRDIKPTNFLYDPATQRGVLVDFGLAEREGSDSKPCLCHETEPVRKARLRAAYAAHGGLHSSNGSGGSSGYPKNDTRPARRANRAGTRGFRAPEVLFKCTEQTTKIDVWSAGVILLTLLSRRFPFFNSADDVEAMIEIATLFGSRRMRAAAQLHGCMFETTIPTVGREGFSLEKIVLWSNCRIDNGRTLKPLSPAEKLAVKFLGRCLDLDPSSRISAEEALDHEFLREKPLGTDIPAGVADDDDEMDIL
ncbi:cell cycle protein [Niveomyces insectorum RCEF 264]|uniref:non-specific serine/threonine protein kinase n=1 Tax=Niveomyces insectorum RCEF 264 TaxID=1081102 RepID=A0A167SNQ2_9HYPO|nr:cell cycle protein [Niveomyces insectorum RCEF 264]